MVENAIGLNIKMKNGFGNGQETYLYFTKSIESWIGIQRFIQHTDKTSILLTDKCFTKLFLLAYRKWSILNGTWYVFQISSFGNDEVNSNEFRQKTHIKFV